jgi:hypothetical protein
LNDKVTLFAVNCEPIFSAKSLIITSLLYGFSYLWCGIFNDLIEYKTQKGEVTIALKYHNKKAYKYEYIYNMSIYIYTHIVTVVTI